MNDTVCTAALIFVSILSIIIIGLNTAIFINMVTKDSVAVVAKEGFIEYASCVNHGSHAASPSNNPPTANYY